MERLAGRLRQPFYIWVASMGRTMLAVMRGTPDAEAQVFAAFELGTAGGQPDALAGFGAQMFPLRQNQGRLAELTDALRANVEAMPHAPSWRAALAALYSETDQVTEAREQVDILRAGGFDPPLNLAWMTYMSRLSEAVCHLHDRSAAAVLYEHLRPLAGQVYVLEMTIGCSGSIAFWGGLLAACLGRCDDAERHFDDALAMNERLGARPCVVRIRRAWASMLLERNAADDAARARELIAAGRAEAETLGMAREIVRLERLRARLESGSTE